MINKQSCNLFLLFVKFFFISSCVTVPSKKFIKTMDQELVFKKNFRLHPSSDQYELERNGVYIKVHISSMTLNCQQALKLATDSLRTLLKEGEKVQSIQWRNAVIDIESYSEKPQCLYLLGLSQAVARGIIVEVIPKKKISKINEEKTQLRKNKKIKLKKSKYKKNFDLKRNFTSNGIGVSRKSLRDTLLKWDIVLKKGVPVRGEDNYVGSDNGIMVQLIGPSENIRSLDLIVDITNERAASTAPVSILGISNVIDPKIKEWVEINTEKLIDVKSKEIIGIVNTNKVTLRLSTIAGATFFSVGIEKNK